MFPILETNRIVLRQITDADLPNIFKGLSNPEIVKHYAVSFHTEEETKEQMEWYADLEKNETGIWWAVCSKDDGRFLGAGGLCDVSKQHKKAEIGFWLLQENWGRGYMSEAMTLIHKHSFNEMGLHRIEGYVESGNFKCKKAIEKLQYTLEGTMRDCEFKNGKFISVDIYAKLSGL